MEFVVITGMSGAGKSCVMNALEDIGFFITYTYQGLDYMPAAPSLPFPQNNKSPEQEGS